MHDKVKIKDFVHMTAAEKALSVILNKVSSWHGRAMHYNSLPPEKRAKLGGAGDHKEVPLWVMRQYDELLDDLGKHSDDDKGPWRDSLVYRIVCTQCGGDGAVEDPDRPGSMTIGRSMACYRCGTEGYEWVDGAALEELSNPCQPYGGVDCPNDEPEPKFLPDDSPEGKFLNEDTARADEDEVPF